jgi:hypothetical protein
LGEDDTGPCYRTLALETAKHLETKYKHIFGAFSFQRSHYLSLITSSGKVCIPMVAYTVSVSNRFFFMDMALLSPLLLGKIYMRHLHGIIINTGD